MTHTAYDYDAQEWVDGPAALDLLIRQTQETLDLLESPRGADYAAMTGVTQDKALRDARRFRRAILADRAAAAADDWTGTLRVVRYAIEADAAEPEDAVRLILAAILRRHPHLATDRQETSR